MILLDNENSAILNILRKKSIIPESGKVDPVDANLPDDDGILYHIHSSTDDKAIINIDVKVPFFDDIKAVDINTFMSGVYKASWSSPISGWHYRVIHNVTLPEDEKDASCLRVSLFRRNLYGAILSFFYSKMATGCNRVNMTIRSGEHITFDCKTDRVTVTYTVAFKDLNDIITSRIFLQEFKEGKKAGKNAPAVMATFKDPPAELSGLKVPSGPEVGYLTFLLTPAHGNAANMPKTIDSIHNFLPYLKYHMSCSKAYLHFRMRSKTEDFIKILNRARPETLGDKKSSSRSTIKT